MFDHLYNTNHYHTQSALEIEMRVRARERERALQVALSHEESNETNHATVHPFLGWLTRLGNDLKPSRRQLATQSHK
jgi:hypothetical protein